jgi:hypothetical protein
VITDHVTELQEACDLDTDYTSIYI